jgi:dihydroxyacetone kinase-like predicted kinase
MGLTLNAAAFRDWTQLCAAALSAARAEIDALNVFPVPDSDTGTNAYLTLMRSRSRRSSGRTSWGCSRGPRATPA